MKYIKFLKLGLVVLALLILPLASFAQGDPDPNDPNNWFDASDFDAQNNPEEIDDVDFSDFPSGENTNSSGNSGGGGGSSCDLGNNPKFDDLITYITCIISISVIPLIFVLAFMLFIWGVVQYVINDTEEAKREKGKQFMLWGIIALFVMFSVWGLVAVLGNTFGIEYVIPQVAD